MKGCASNSRQAIRCTSRKGARRGEGCNKSIGKQGRKVQLVRGVGFEAKAEFDTALSNQVQHLFMYDIQDRDIDFWVLFAVDAKKAGEQIGRERGHCRNGDMAAL